MEILVLGALLALKTLATFIVVPFFVAFITAFGPSLFVYCLLIVAHSATIPTGYLPQNRSDPKVSWPKDATHTSTRCHTLLCPFLGSKLCSEIILCGYFDAFVRFLLCFSGLHPWSRFHCLPWLTEPLMSNDLSLLQQGYHLSGKKYF